MTSPQLIFENTVYMEIPYDIECKKEIDSTMSKAISNRHFL